MFNEFPQSDLTIVSTDGSVSHTKGIVSSSDAIVIPDAKAAVDIGYEIRRSLPNGKDETFEVVDPVFHQQFGSIPAHFQVKVRKKGLLPAGGGGNYTITVNGPNSRVNIHSQDNSNNVAHDLKVFEDARAAIVAQVPDSENRARIIGSLDEAKAAAGNPETYRSAYQKLISSAADHVTVLAPFLPILTSFLG
ncbi:hypothetical protein GFB56_05490 [Ensifer sp. T173]|uniref:Uncharacterized protein n=1 Tax=Ensifer canadensis TaxID=555315 RepID=A0AAW4FGU4_9HYPH|nr:hypothetical protein [Ensifer canadensis]MBM3090266.1 hypothetical protein [Ensifer canadensis]UBI75800.1 hypothetical protein J3R84_01165 [Ensifer canadensis]